MNSKYNINIYGNLEIKNKFYVLAKLLLTISEVGLILFSFIGDIGRTANEFYISNGIGVVKLILSLSVFCLPIYLMKISLEFMNTQSINFSIIELIGCIFAGVVIFNYWIYYDLTNNKKVIYLVICCLIIWLIKSLISIIIQYRFWEKIHEEGIKLYGDSFEEYHEVVIEYNKSLTDREQLDICINLFNSVCGLISIDLVKLQIKYKKWREKK
ncbi:MAG: hypothetical protein E7C50_00400 [Clostridium sp.]|uniref:hypothetical protein n=1 Tax=Clostridium sp. TaxID=1506 RepID=UPI002903768B|nr:hypothetical protein [Clostridium sp.]MDU2674224.1 hypothetical protein [Clostridium sp.]MDU2680319.1 hypothetical protein [Clostridium sp.]